MFEVMFLPSDSDDTIKLEYVRTTDREQAERVFRKIHPDAEVIVIWPVEDK